MPIHTWQVGELSAAREISTRDTLSTVHATRSADEMRRYGVRTILDLRRMDRPCKKAAANVHEARLRRLGNIISKVSSTCPCGSASTVACGEAVLHRFSAFAELAHCVHCRPASW